MYMSGYDNLKMIGNLYKNVDKERIDQVIKIVGLEKRIKDKVSKYSLGIAQAILHKPNLLILDEPTNGLDPEGIKQLRDLLVDLAQKEKMGILISSHNLSELESFCTKIAIIKNGENVENSSIEEAKKVDGKNIYEVEIDKIEGIDNIIKNKHENVDKNNLKVYASKEEIPEIIEQLVKNKYKVYKVCEESNSLEEAFLKKTGGNVID